MASKTTASAILVLMLTAFISAGCGGNTPDKQAEGKKSIVTSDTILSGMCESLLPAESFTAAAILPPGQCPGHYDVKLSDLARVKKADLVISFVNMPFMQDVERDADREIRIDTQGRNWMAPPFYVEGLKILADRLSGRFPEHAGRIAERRDRAIREVAEKDRALGEKIRRAGIAPAGVIASSMLRGPLEWMGCRIAGEYGRPESISAREIASLIRIGRESGAALIVDNLQSGPEAGKGIAEALKVPHVVIANFPSENGYLATLEENVDAVLAAGRM